MANYSVCLVAWLFAVLPSDIKYKYSNHYQLLAIKAINCSIFIEPDQKEKIEGISIAREAIQKGDRRLAATVYMNLLNKNPGDMEIIEEYQKFITEYESANVQDLDELSGLLSISAFKVPVNQVKKVMDMIRIVQIKRNELAKLNASKNKDEPRDIENEIIKLVAFAKSPPSDEAKIKKAIQDMANILNELDPSESRFKEIENYTRDLSVCLEGLNKSAYINACLEKITTVNLDSEIALSLIQAAESALPSLYGIKIPDNRMPQELKDSINELPAIVKKRTEDISEARSKQVLLSIENISNEALAIDWNEKGMTWEMLCNKIEIKIKAIHLKASLITSAKVLQEAKSKIDRVQESLASARRGQYREYQLWAIQKLNTSFNDYNDYKWTSPGNKAFEILTNNEIHTIDLGLLSPEASRCYSDIVPKLLGQLSPARLPEWYELCVKTTKIKLESK